MAAAPFGLPGKSRVILIEFNELCPALLDTFMADGQLPHFQAFYDAAQVYVTEPDVEDAQKLEPWIQWYSLHTGLAFDQHGVFHLTDGPKNSHRDIWNVLADAGKRVGNCASMNVRGMAAPDSFFIPDPWCTTETAHPVELGKLHRLIAHHVQEYSNRGAISLSDYAEFVMFMATHGLRPQTVLAALSQMIRDTIFQPSSSWKRATILDRILLDLFRYLYRRVKPDFSTFFANSTAHFQHSYWRYWEPEKFAVQPNGSDDGGLADAIPYGYRRMDALIGEFMRIAGDDTLLVFASALGQQPFLKREASGGQRFYRVKDINGMLRSLDIDYESVQPVMTHQYMLSCADASSAVQARARMEQYQVEGAPLFDFSGSEPGTVYFGAGISGQVPDDAIIKTRGGNDEGVQFFELFYQIDETKSARHHPDGALWFMTGTHRKHVEKASILDVFPTLLDLFGVPIPESASGGSYRGTSLLPGMIGGA